MGDFFLTGTLPVPQGVKNESLINAMILPSNKLQTFVINPWSGKATTDFFLYIKLTPEVGL